MTRAVGLFAAALLATSLGVAPDTSTSGTASRQNNASIQTPASNLSPTTTGCRLGSAPGTGSVRLPRNRARNRDPGDRSAQPGYGVDVTGQRMSGTPSDASAERLSDGRAKPATQTATGDGEGSARGSATEQASNRTSSMGNSTIRLVTSAISVLPDPCESLTAPSPGSSSGALLGATERSNSTRLLVGPGTTSSENAPPAEPGPDDQASQVTGENLPQTSNLLPLLGLVGVGSLIAGFFMRR
jgi:hypothetical protein